MRPIASTAVASMQNIAAPDSASELIWVKCQSLASPFSAEYWHIGATMMRLGSARPRSLIGENRALMYRFPVGEEFVLAIVYVPPPRLPTPGHGRISIARFANARRPGSSSRLVGRRRQDDNLRHGHLCH